MGVWQEVAGRSNSPHTSGLSQQPNGHGSPQPSSPTTLLRDSPPAGIEVLQYVKYTHLVPAQVSALLCLYSLQNATAAV